MLDSRSTPTRAAARQRLAHRRVFSGWGVHHPSPPPAPSRLQAPRSHSKTSPFDPPRRRRNGKTPAPAHRASRRLHPARNLRRSRSPAGRGSAIAATRREFRPAGRRRPSPVAIVSFVALSPARADAHGISISPRRNNQSPFASILLHIRRAHQPTSGFAPARQISKHPGRP